MICDGTPDANGEVIARAGVGFPLHHTLAVHLCEPPFRCVGMGSLYWQGDTVMGTLDLDGDYAGLTPMIGANVLVRVKQPGHTLLQRIEIMELCLAPEPSSDSRIPPLPKA